MTRDRILLFALSALLFVPFLGSAHLFDWDEINFAESAREMLATGDFWRVQVNFEPFREKPPLFFWMQTVCMAVFGVGEFAARLPNAICGIVTLQVMFGIALRWHNRAFAWAWVLLYMGSVLPHLYFKSGIIDPWFNLFIFLSVYHLFIALVHKDRGEVKHALLAGLFSGLAILTKGPVGFLLLLLTFLVHWAFTRFRKPASVKAVLVFAGTVFAVSALWFAHEWLQHGAWFIVEFTKYQVELFLHPVAGHKQPFFYHFAVVLVGCFPLSVLALPAFGKGFAGDTHGLSRWMKYLFWVVMVLFSIVTTKIVHYSSMAYLPLSYLAALVVQRHAEGATIKRWQLVWLWVQGALLAVAFAAVPALLMFKEKWLHLVRDPFVAGNLSADVFWMGWEWLPGVMLLGVGVVAWRLHRERSAQSFVVLCLGMALCLALVMAVLVPRIEGYSQGAVIAFFEAHQGAHIETYKYKSYAHFFYGRVQPTPASGQGFIVCKIQHKNQLMAEHPTAQHLYDEGGFSFWVMR